MNEFTIWGLGGAAAVLLLVQLAKALAGEGAIKDRAAIALAVAAGLLLSAASYFSEQNELVRLIVNLVGGGLLAGLAACGIYSAVKNRA